MKILTLLCAGSLLFLSACALDPNYQEYLKSIKHQSDLQADHELLKQEFDDEGRIVSQTFKLPPKVIVPSQKDPHPAWKTLDKVIGIGKAAVDADAQKALYETFSDMSGGTKITTQGSVNVNQNSGNTTVSGSSTIDNSITDDHSAIDSNDDNSYTELQD